MWTKWAIDASRAPETYGCFCFCPIDPKTGAILTGMSCFAAQPPGVVENLILFHPDGVEACKTFADEYTTALEDLQRRLQADGKPES